MSTNQQPQGSDSKGKVKAPLPTLEPRWQPTPFSYNPNVPDQDLVVSLPLVSVDDGGANVLPGIDSLLARTASFESVDRRPSAHGLSTMQQVDELALTISVDQGKATPQEFDPTNSTTCPSCGDHFAYTRELDSLLAVQHPDFRWQCSICKLRKYKSRRTLRNHTRDHLGQLPRRLCPVECCESVQKGFLNRREFDTHMNNQHPNVELYETSTEDVVYQGTVSGDLTLGGFEGVEVGLSDFGNVEGRQYLPMTLATQQNYEPATSTKPVEATPHQYEIVESTICPVCGDELSYMGKLDAHVNENHPDFRWPCPLCKKTYREGVYLRDHLRGPDHSAEAPRHYCSLEGCRYFRKSFSDSRHGHDHLKNKHPGNPDAKLVRDTTLPGPLLSPKRLKPNPGASTAPLKFVNVTPGFGNFEGVEGQHPPPTTPTTNQGNEVPESSEAEGRLILSNMLKATTCPVCASKMPSLTQLEEHLAKQHPDFRWQCPLCTQEEKLYKVRNYLKAHVAMDHSGEKQRFYCPVEGCEKSQTGYRKRWHLAQHVNDKHPERADLDPELQVIAPRNKSVFKKHDPRA